MQDALMSLLVLFMILLPVTLNAVRNKDGNKEQPKPETLKQEDHNKPRRKTVVTTKKEQDIQIPSRQQAHVKPIEPPPYRRLGTQLYKRLD